MEYNKKIGLRRSALIRIPFAICFGELMLNVKSNVGGGKWLLG